MVHFLSIFVLHVYLFNMYNCTTAHPWYDGHSISKSTCGVWGARAGVQVSGRKLHTHIHLNYDEVEILSWIKKNFKKNTYSCIWFNVMDYYFFVLYIFVVLLVYYKSIMNFFFLSCIYLCYFFCYICYIFYYFLKLTVIFPWCGFFFWTVPRPMVGTRILGLVLVIWWTRLGSPHLYWTDYEPSCA